MGFHLNSKVKLLSGIPILTLGCLSAVLFSIVKSNHAAEGSVAKEAVLVQVEEIEARDLRKTFQLFTVLQPWKEAVIRPQGHGLVHDLSVQVGQKVERDQVIFRMNSESLKLRSELEKIDFEMKKNDFKVAMALARKDFLSKQEVRQKELENRSSEIRARLSELENHGVYRTPIPGIVSDIGFKVGDFLDSNSSSSIKIVDLEKLKVSFWVPQVIATQINLSTEVIIDLDKSETPAKLVTIAPTVDQKTGSVFVEAQIDERPTEWLAGQYVQVRLTLKKYSEVLSISRKAIVQEKDKTYVYKIVRDNGQTKARGLASENQPTEPNDLVWVKKVEVEVPATENDWSQVVPKNDQLEVYDQVVIQGISGLSDGMSVKVSED